MVYMINLVIRRLENLLPYLGLALWCVALSACSAKPSDGPTVKYELRGKIVSVDLKGRQVVVDHQAVPGFMEAMTMPFTVRDGQALKEMAAGDQLQATLVVADSGAWLENTVITKAPTGSAPGDVPAASAEPEPGREVPDFTLVNQDGKRVRINQYRGRALLLAFIYTRCPLPEYCPLMSDNFARLNQQLLQDTTLRDKSHLLSISIDPAHDTPQVLRSYGAAQTEAAANEKFGRWEFLTGEPDEVKRMAQFFGLSYFEDRDQVIHSLRTALIAPDGRVHKVYRGNDWKTDDVLRDFRTLLTP